jgi:hypothetical protein
VRGPRLKRVAASADYVDFLVNRVNSILHLIPRFLSRLPV